MRRGIQSWLDSDSLSLPAFVWRNGAAVTRGAIVEAAAQACAAVLATPHERILLTNPEPRTFLAEFLGTLAAGRTPVLSGGHRLSTLLPHADAMFPGTETGSLPVVRPSQGRSAALPAIQDEGKFVLFTSGSTGTPKAVRKTVRQMDLEAEATVGILGAPGGIRSVAATVDPLHLYGLTFAVWLPMSCGIPRLLPRLETPEEISGIPRGSVLVSSPSFLHFLDPRVPAPVLSGLVSAGAPLGDDDAAKARDYLGTVPTEIYGSTETGVVGFRLTDRPGKPVSPAPGVSVNGDGSVSSPFCEGGRAELGDRVRVLQDGRFELLGRKDRIVKVAEERVSLGEVEAAVRETLGFTVIALVIEKGGRRMIGAVADLSRSGGFERARSREYRRELSKRLRPAAIPRCWRAVPSFPLDRQGKVDLGRIRELFN